ncbi:MAG: hypothetical protein AAB383_03385 [Patescibacteria group bacterium]
MNECENTDADGVTEESASLVVENGLSGEALQALKDALVRAGLTDSPVHRDVIVQAYGFACNATPSTMIKSGFAPEYLQRFAEAVDAGSPLKEYAGDMFVWAQLQNGN